MRSDISGGSQGLAVTPSSGRRAAFAALLVLFTCLFVLLPASAQAKSYSDVYSDWYTEYVTYVSDKGLMTGYTDGTNRFGVGDTVTRGMVATVLYRFATGDAGSGGTSSTFKDVKSKEWYTKPIEWCYKKGVVTGDKNAAGKLTGYFRPNDPVTREELAVMLYRFAKQYGYVSGSESWKHTFSDSGSISAWALEGVRWCQSKDIITGYVEANGRRTILPQNNAVRAEMAKMLTVFCRDVFGGTAKAYTYELYTVGQSDLAPYTGVASVIFIKTDATPSSLKLVDQTDSGASIGSVSKTYERDIDVSGVSSGVFGKVKGGWVCEARFSKAGTHTLALYDGTRWLATFTLKVQDFSAAEDAWIDAVIAKTTNSSMDSFAKMTAVSNWLYSNFSYLDNKLENGGNYLVYLARRNVPYFVSYQWDSYVSPAVLCKFAKKIGGFDSVENMYNSGDWSKHYYCKCVKGSTTKYFQACPVSSTGLIESWDMVDFTKPASYLHYDPKVLRHIPGTALTGVAGMSLDGDEATFDEVEGLSSAEGQASGADAAATFDDVAGSADEATYGMAEGNASGADAGEDSANAGDSTDAADVAADGGSAGESADASGADDTGTADAPADGADDTGAADVPADVTDAADVVDVPAGGTDVADAPGDDSTADVVAPDDSAFDAADVAFDTVELAEVALAA